MSNQEQSKEDKQRETHDRVVKELKEGVSTWEDLYAKLEVKMKDYGLCGCPFHAADALYHTYALIVALKELPEEGDVLKIIEYMAVVIAYHGTDKMMVTPASDTRRGMSPLAGLLSMILQSGGVPQPDTESGPAEELHHGTKKHLH